MRALGLLLLLALPAQASTFYEYRGTNGSLAFTDDAERIPAAYQTAAIERAFEDLKDRRSIVENPARAPQVPTLEPTEKKEEPCREPVTVRRERRQDGDFNRTYWIAEQCGERLYDSPNPIRLRIAR